jgi:hypothetical protein
VLAECAAVYDPQMHEAPIVIGHPKDNGPAFGWIEKLEARQEGLFGFPKQLAAELTDLVKKGAYKKISGSFYRPDSPNNPTPGKFYLRHVGFLGATPPAVKGLAAVELNDSAAATFDFEESVLELLEQRIFARERAVRHEENRLIVQKLAEETRILFADVEPLLSFINGLSDEQVVEFSDAAGDSNSLSQVKFLLNFLKTRPRIVTLGELATGEIDDDEQPFDVPDTYEVDPEMAGLHAKALAYQRANGCTYTDSVRAVVRKK